MSFWRPSEKNVYIFPDIHGSHGQLQNALKRIIPLKRGDLAIFLGDYIDRNSETYEVIETLISLRKKYNKEQLILLRGNHEQLLLDALGTKGTGFSLDTITPYAMWIQNGGVETIQSYAKHVGVEIKNPKELPSSRCLSFIDKNHIKFLQEETQLYYELEIDNHKFQFAHAAIDPNLPIDKQDEDVLMWDRSLYANAKKIAAEGKELFWAKDRTIITGHNFEAPFFTPGYIMLDGSAHGKLYVLELNSMECFSSSPGHDRLVKYNIKES